MSVNKMSIYDRQVGVKQMSIDCLPLRKHCRKLDQVYISSACLPSVKRPRHIHGLDMYDKSKVLSAMARRRCKHHVNQKRQPMYSILSTDGQVLYTLKSKDLVKKCQALVNKGIAFSVKQV